MVLLHCNAARRRIKIERQLVLLELAFDIGAEILPPLHADFLRHDLDNHHVVPTMGTTLLPDTLS